MSEKKCRVLLSHRLDNREFILYADCLGRELSAVIEQMSLADVWRTQAIDLTQFYDLRLSVTTKELEEDRHERNGRK
jgi:hypothetical protein